MMGRPPRVPVDLQAVTRDVKARLRRVIGELEVIEQQSDPVFAAPRDVYIDLDMAIQRLNAGATPHPAAVELTNVYHNLLRRWADV